MADPQKLDVPAAAASTNEPLIFAMPEKYRGGALSTKVPAPAALPPPKVKSVVPPPPPPPPPKPAPRPGLPGAKKKGMPTSTKMLIVVGFLFVCVLGAIGLWVWLSLQPPKVANIQSPGNASNHPTNTTPPVTTPPVNTPPVNTPPVTTPPFSGQLTPGRDSDSDGLTDVEEALYGTNPRLPDTDADSFLDGNEVFHGYDPLGVAPSTLLTSGLAKPYTDGIYSMLYPSAWSLNTVAGQPTAAVFTVPSGETVTVATEAKDPSMSLSDWFATANPGVSAANLTDSKSLSGYEMLVSRDQLTAYLDLGDSVVTVTYAAGVKPTIDYLTTFQMMVNSVHKL